MMLHKRANLSVNPSSIKFKFYDSQKGSNRRIIQNSITDKRSVKKNYFQKVKRNIENKLNNVC